MAAKAPGQAPSLAPDKAWLADLELSKAAVHFRAGRFEEAIAAYSASLEMRPEQPVVWANRAAAHLKLGRPAEAEADCTEALNRDPGHAKAMARRANARAEQGKWRLALRDVTAALRLGLKPSPALQELEDRAVQELLREPLPVYAWAEPGATAREVREIEVPMEEGYRDYAAEQAEREEALQESEADMQRYIDTATALLQSGKNDEALEQLDAAIRSIKPDYAEAHLWRGNVCLRVFDDPEAAVREFVVALDLDKDGNKELELPLHLRLMHAQHCLSDVDGARASLESAKACAGKSPGGPEFMERMLRDVALERPELQSLLRHNDGPISGLGALDELSERHFGLGALYQSAASRRVAELEVEAHEFAKRCRHEARSILESSIAQRRLLVPAGERRMRRVKAIVTKTRIPVKMVNVKPKPPAAASPPPAEAAPAAAVGTPESEEAARPADPPELPEGSEDGSGSPGGGQVSSVHAAVAAGGSSPVGAPEPVEDRAERPAQSQEGGSASLRLQADEARSRGEHAQAQALYLEHLGQQPSDTCAWSNLATSCSWMKQTSSAIHALEEALNVKEPLPGGRSRFDLHFKLGAVLSGCGRHEEAVRAFERAGTEAVTAEEKSNVARRIQKSMKALGAEGSGAAPSGGAVPPPPRPASSGVQAADEAREAGNALFRESNFHGALEQYNKAAALDPTNVPTLTNASRTLYLLHRYAESEEAASKALALDPGSFKAYFRRGEARFAQRKHLDAWHDLRAAEALALGKSKKPVQDVKPVQALLRKLEYEMEAKGMPVPKDAGFVA